MNTRAADWSTPDIQREAGYIGVSLLDYLQTQNIRRDPSNWHEENNMLGLHPSAGAINRYFLGMVSLHVAAVAIMPHTWRRDFQNVTIGIEAGYVAHNLSVGISASF